jgi:hypothetical protein
MRRRYGCFRSPAVRRDADRHAAKVLPIIEIERAGARSLR